MRRKATLAITLAAAMAATAVPAMADDKVSITIFNSKMEVQSQFEEMAEKYAEDNGINIEVYYSNDTVAARSGYQVFIWRSIYISNGRCKGCLLTCKRSCN